MKKQIILFILSIYLISGTELRELIKLPVLFQHFYEHKALNSEISFSTYLADHYNSIPHSDNDEERDNQLPFKTPGFNGLSMQAIPQFYCNYVKSPIRAIIPNDSFPYTENCVPAPDCGQIWQPPKA
uniref:hypothetical protein n=1 Tax=Pedobacter schmidteae TaxID=2201271 RepID=UPI000EB1ABE2|nr:hypothetical protein [Pedobacter schmidteae]